MISLILCNSESDGIIRAPDQHDKEGRHLCHPKHMQASLEFAVSKTLFEVLKIAYGLTAF